MDLTSKKLVKNLLREHNIYPSKSLGQNFLISEKVLEKILKAANLKPEDVVLEIGPGIGALTFELAKKVKKVIAVEKDKRLVKILKETLKDFKNVEIIQGDILKIQFSMNSEQRTANNKKGLFIAHCSLFTGYKVVANLPYYITSPVIRMFLEATIQPQEMILMVQKEVAQRIIAQPPDMNLLAVSVQFYTKPEIISFVSKNCFWPPPKVDSAIIRIVPRRSALYSASFCERFFRIARAGFSQPRKQLANSLAKGLKLEKEVVQTWLEKNKILPQRRPQTLTIKEWMNLTGSLKSLSF